MERIRMENLRSERGSEEVREATTLGRNNKISEEVREAKTLGRNNKIREEVKGKMENELY